MAKADYSTLMTKIANIFKSDMYIINSTYCIGGKDSEEKNNSYALCLLNKEYSDIIKELFPDEEIIYIKDVKKSKEDLSLVSTDIKEKEKILKRYKDLLEIVNSITAWENLKLPENAIKTVFKDGLTYELFKDEDIPSVLIAKSLFPMVSEKNIDTLAYNVIIPNNEFDLVKLVTSLNTEWFQIFNLIQYLQIK